MRLSSLATLLLAAALAAGCTGGGTSQVASPQCDQFATSGGYPILTGGFTFGPNSLLEQLPNVPPVWIAGIGEDDIQAHLNEEDYLRNWCLAYMR